MKRLFSTLLTLTFILFTFSAPAVEFLANGTSLTAFAEDSLPNVITAGSIQLEYARVTYNGTERTPEVFVKLGDVTLSAGVDYTVKYPADCVNAGEKTIVVTGKGDYTGEVKVGYRITPLSCTDNPDVEVTAADCYYNGLPQFPELTVKYAALTIPKSDYTVALSNNVEVGSSAKCVVKFRGNYTGEREVSFNILKRKGDDFEIDLVAKAGQTVSVDLAQLKPSGAIFGNPVFSEKDFVSGSLPKVAFNVLKFTLSPDIKRSTVISIPMTNIASSEDYWLEFYIEIVDKDIPKLTLKPVNKEYDGKPVGIAAIEDSGSFAFLDGKVLEGQWSFSYWTTPPTLPCENEYFEVEFTPNNPEYSHVYGLLPITVSRMDAKDFQASAENKIEVSEVLKVTVTRIPEDFDGTVTVSGGEEDEITVLYEEETEEGRVFALDFPFDEARYTIKASLDGSAFYAPKTIKMEVTVGNPADEPSSDVTTTADMLSALIEKAEAGSVVKANKTPVISADLLRAALAKNLTIEVKANDAITYVIDPAKMHPIAALNLSTAAAVIPQVLLDKTGDTVAHTFTTYARNYGGVSVKATVDSKLPIACFYLYNTSGELEHITSIPLKGQTVMFELPDSGKYAVTTGRVSHILRDLDNDCMITFEDINIAISIFLSIDGNATQDQIDAMDFDGDGYITFEDINDIIDYFLKNV
ncbi:MAG: hypothetical protein ACI4JS_08175 [Oscillospiraceae bacterium]